MASPEYISGKTLRSLALWKGQEPEKIPDFVLKELQQLVPSWRVRDYFKKYLRQKTEVSPPTGLERRFLENLMEIVGKESVSVKALDRIKFSHGFSTEDLIRIRKGEFAPLAEVVVFPKTEDEMVKILALCEQNEVPLIPVGGRTSVTRALHFARPGIALSLRPHFTKILEISSRTMTVTTEAGILGPELESKLNDRGFTIGHFPQSFEQSTVGGWIAARGAGQNSTLRGKIEDLVINLRLVTARGMIEPPLSPASAVGPQKLPLFVGSEGTLGIITRATLRMFVDPTPHRRFASYLFSDFYKGIEAVEELSQEDFLPAVARLSDGLETMLYSIIGKTSPQMDAKSKLLERYLSWKGYKPKRRSLLLLVFEGNKEYAKNADETAARIMKKHGALNVGQKFAKKWFTSRFEHPHLRDFLLDIGLLIDTIETASTWDKLPSLYENTVATLEKDADLVFAHVSHLYPAGASLYFTYVTSLEEGKEIDQCRRLQEAAVESFVKNGGVVSHHHGIGKAFIPWAKQQWDDAALEMMRGLKERLDPKHVLNPGNFPFND